MGGSDRGANWCNQCTCTDGGLACTEMACGAPTRCTLADGSQVESGWHGLDSDGCNTCGCNNGMLACTLMACAPDVSDWDMGKVPSSSVRAQQLPGVSILAFGVGFAVAAVRAH
mmetsp:Transcript_50132/g.119331  ORF Transcript_50132/g.119331 Transcript_50132/m.119331 type:complete len:114 (-) Transcript_50132:272-613(-)